LTGAGDDLRRGAVAPHRVDGYGKVRACHSISIACRPWYQPQCGQTTCGSFVRRHCGQMLRGGSLSVQAEARRLRLFDFEVFFLGTAIVVSLIGPRVGRLARAGLVVAVHAALGAQALAVLLTERCERQLKDTSIVDEWFQVEKIAVEAVAEVRIRVVRAHL